MNSWPIVTLLCGLALGLAYCASIQIPEKDINEPDLHCAFERDRLCGWADVSTSQDLSWETYNTPDSMYMHSTGPWKDHTTGRGHFLSMRTSHKYEPGSAVLESLNIATNHETCLSFWYFMYGTAVGGLYVYKIGEGDQKQELFSMFGFQGKRWYKAVIETGSGAFQLQIEATFVAKRDYANIAIDDIAFSYEGCQEDESALLEDQPRIDCNFERGPCAWFFSRPRTLAWRTAHVPADSNDRNALNPESNDSSYLEVVKNSRSYDTETWLTGPTFSADSESCLSFWYKINGTLITRVQLKLVNYGESFYRGKTLFSTYFQGGPVWLQALVTVPAGNNTHLDFRVVGSRQNDGSFGLDDIHLARGQPCLEDPESLINCDFEKDFCRWYMQTKKDEDDWIRTKDPTPMNSTGPSHDHTTGDGYFIFLDASDVQEANLYSVPFSVSSSGACLSFWYYMHGPDVHTLELRSVMDSNSEIIWSMMGPQGDRWIQQEISLTDGYEIYLVFTAQRSYFPRGDIALDDISITFGSPCQSDTTEPATDLPEFSRYEPTTELPGTAVTTPPAPTTTTTEPPPLETPQVLVKGDINPAYINSRLELICQSPEQKNVWIRWYRRRKNVYNFEKNRLEDTWSRSLLFDELHLSDAGFYSCVVESYYIGTSNASEEVQVSVVPDPRPSPLLKIRPSEDEVFFDKNSIDVLEEAVIQLECGDEINGGEYHWKTTSHAFYKLNLYNDRILVVNSTQEKYSGTYSCRISKDGFMTAKSNELKISIRPGKRCESDWQCYGNAYFRDCQNHRCACFRDAVLRGRECKERPERPTIRTSPPFLEFGIGESFYLVCDAKEPAPANLSYAFVRRYSNEKSPGILRISNATAADSGAYRCLVTFTGIDSKESPSIYIQIKDFINLDCDFAKDFCEWVQKKETATSNFAIISSDGHVQIDGPSGSFIKTDASNSTVPGRAILLSPTIDRMALDACLTFWYRLHGPDVHSLSVWRYLYSEDWHMFEGNKLWTVIGDKGDGWYKQTVTIGNGTKFYVAFDAVGQVAIDDVLFTYRGGC